MKTLDSRWFGIVPGGYGLTVARSETLGVRVIVGCRNFSYREATEHWAKIALNEIEVERKRRAQYIVKVLPAIRTMLENEGWDFTEVKPKVQKYKRMYGYSYWYKADGAEWRHHTLWFDSGREAITSREGAIGTDNFADVGDLVSVVRHWEE